jgi:glycosyltransferase involved in cell wall biosynthesis
MDTSPGRGIFLGFSGIGCKREYYFGRTTGTVGMRGIKLDNMKILHLISSRGFFGAENVAVTLSREQKKLGGRVWLGVFEDKRDPHCEIAEEAQKHGVKTIIFPCKGKFDLNTVFRIKKFIKTEQIDILHSHGYKSNIYAVLAGNRYHTKRVSTCHSWSLNSMKMKSYKYLDILFLKKYDSIIAVSDLLKNEIVGSGITPVKVTVINNGIDADEFLRPHADSLKIRESMQIGITEKVIGAIGRLDFEKGFDYLLDAFKKINNDRVGVKLLIVGDGPLKNDLKLKASDLNLKDNVIFSGIRNNISQMLSIMDIFVMSSTAEGLPIALLEAMAAKKPVVVTKVGAIPNVIEDGHSGILVEPKDSDSLAEAILSLLNDSEKASGMAQKGFERVRDKYSSKRMAEEYYSIYKKLK